jgi:apolipoprotein N-acyltransferase
MVQPNIGNQEKQWELYGPQFKTEIISKHFELTSQALAKEPADLIVWPETSMPEYMGTEFYSVPNVASTLNFIRQHHTGLFTGAYAKDMKTEQDSNAIYLFDENAKYLGIYKKHILLAFGEYMPFSKYFPILLKIFPTVADFERGSGPHILKFHNVKLGPQICYEGLHPWFSEGLAKQNADILVNITNDSWFGHTFESYQHLYMTLMRAVEFRRPMVRVTNTGISAAVNATGHLLAFSPQKTEWAHTVIIPYLSNAPRSFYSHFIYLDHLLVLLAILAIFRWDVLICTIIKTWTGLTLSIKSKTSPPAKKPKN